MMYLFWRLQVNPTVCIWHHGHISQFKPHGAQVGVAGEAVTAVKGQSHLTLHLVAMWQRKEQLLSPLNVGLEVAHWGLSLPPPPIGGEQACNIAVTPCLHAHVLRWRQNSQRMDMCSLDWAEHGMAKDPLRGAENENGKGDGLRKPLQSGLTAQYYQDWIYEEIGN